MMKNTNEKKKRGRKPKNSKKISKRKKISIAEQDYGFVDAQSTHTLESSNVILHLRIPEDFEKKDQKDMVDSKIETEKTLLKYNPQLEFPEPYEKEFSESFPCPFADTDMPPPPPQYEEKVEECKKDTPPTVSAEDSEWSVQESDVLHKFPVKTFKNDQDYKIKRKIPKQILSEYQNKNYVKELPVSTSFCWWDCNSFDWEPTVIPIRKIGKTFHVIGCFSSPECAAAYIFESGKRYGDPQRMYSWLHILYKREVNGQIVRISPAPKRESLQMFGGIYSIEEFRQKYSNYSVTVRIVMPPIKPVNAYVEEVDKEYKVNRKFIPMDKNRVEKAQSDLRLKRKQKKNNENTLEKFMNLKFGKTD
jgi:hypothetical protein